MFLVKFLRFCIQNKWTSCRVYEDFLNAVEAVQDRDTLFKLYDDAILQLCIEDEDLVSLVQRYANSQIVKRVQALSTTEYLDKNGYAWGPSNDRIRREKNKLVKKACLFDIQLAYEKGWFTFDSIIKVTS